MAEEHAKVTVELSRGVKVEISELTAAQSLRVDDIIGNSLSQMRIMKTYGIASICSIDGEPVMPWKNALEFDKVAKRISAIDASRLAEAYGNAFFPDSDDLKNASTVPTED